jgi:hypothetical protein
LQCGVALGAMNETVLTGIKKLPNFRRSTDGFTRAEVVGAFQTAFQLIGGVNRLTLWANENPDKFYATYAKLLPSSSFAFVETAERQIVHALPPGPLDAHPGSENRVTQPMEHEPVRP